ncbi:MAG TPA: hypothetical protein VMN56_01305 [Casimicrobiaceae bacterium]|nr:hypothetical protein [Casimicrobiaceae bacterium]
MKLTCLRDFMRVNALDVTPPCWYCGERATTLDRPAAKSGPAAVRRPACQRCALRKGRRPVDALRQRLMRIASATTGDIAPIRFAGEGAKGRALERVRELLSTAVRDGETVVVPPGERLTQPRDDAPARSRWGGRATFTGQKALRDLHILTGCSAAVLERFLLGESVSPENAKRLRKACKALGLDVAKLRGLGPKGSAPEAPQRKRAMSIADRIEAAKAAVAAKAGKP